MINRLKFFKAFFWGQNSQIVKMGRFVRFNKETRFEGYNRIGNLSYINNSSLGMHSYIGDNCILNKALIGRYTSIGDRVIIITGNHPTNQNISTSPVFYSSHAANGMSFNYDRSFKEYKYVYNDKYVSIGNDVWIGSDVRIFHGVKIGDGSIIGTGAIVTNDIEPYSINVGIPARAIKMRFNQNIINQLKKIKWWEWETSEIEENAHLFSSPDEFIKVFGDQNGEIPE